MSALTPAPQAAPMPALPRARVRRTPPRRSRRGLVITIAVLALMGLVLAGYALAVRIAQDPEEVVDAYLGALEDGRFGEAAALIATDADAPLNGVLMTDAIGAATADRLTGHSIDAVRIDGDAAQVSVTLHRGTSTAQRDLRLRRAGLLPGAAASWRLEEPDHDYVRIGQALTVTSIHVNGVRVDLSGAVSQDDPDDGLGMILLPAFPGVYDVSYDAEDPAGYLVPIVDEIDVPEAWAAVPFAADAAWSLTDAAQAAAREEVASQLEACAAATVAAPPGCPFAATSLAADAEGTWEITRDPGPVLVTRDAEGRSTVGSSPGAGRATFTPAAVPATAAIPVIFTVSGDLTWDDAGRVDVVLQSPAASAA